MSRRLRLVFSRFAFLCVLTFLMSACGGRVSVPSDVCSPSAPHGTCPAGQTCDSGACTSGGDLGATCTATGDCSSTVCVAGRCRGTTCDNGRKDGDETGVDCGGSCGGCATETCTDSSSCASGVCAGNSQCTGPSCIDGLKNGDETGVDCGGACVSVANGSKTCSNSTPCDVDADCTSHICNVTCQPPASHCTNTTQDSTETGIDCGGADCVPCATGGCSTGTDCASGVCGVGNVCPGPALCACQNPSCSDGVKNGDETAADCGGACVLTANGTKTCGNGSTCTIDGDCTSGICNVTCQPPASHCTNGVTDGGETGLNCGGGECVACADGQPCSASADCVNAICGVGNVCPGPALCACQAPNCSDGLHNGNETGTDCGGDCTSLANGSKTCGNGVPCGVAGDCASGVCNVTCQAPTCPDGVQNNGETGLDCGGPNCSINCGTGGGCTGNADCVSGVCDTLGGTCLDPTCTDGVQNQDEHGIDCAGACLAFGQTCPAGTPCDNPNQCASGFCNATCQASSCSPPDGVKNGFETAVDCGGPDCAGCGVGQTCSINADCTSGFCDGTSHCATVSCGDGFITGTEECDKGATAGTGDDVFPSGTTCVSRGFGGGTLACSATCAISDAGCSGGCGNGAVDSGEQCDGGNLNGQTCTGLGYNGGGTLACTGGCAFDPSGCVSTTCPTCVAGGFCSAATDHLCKCPIYETACSAGCASLLTDPNNCGACGHVCTGGQACSSGVCSGTCVPPLVKCGNRCIDPQTESTHCGAGTNCATNPGTDCVAAFTPDKVCLSGACVTVTPGTDFTGAGDAATRCIGGGPVLDLNPPACDPATPNDPDCVVPPAVDCTGDLASVTFRYALCSCNDIDSSHPLFADGFNSFSGPYSPTCENGVTCSVPGSDNGACATDVNGDGHTTCADDKGAGVGANGSYIHTALITAWGTLWLSNGNPGTYPDQVITSTVEQQLHVGNTLGGGPSRVRGDGFVVNNITASGRVEGTLHQSVGRTSPNMTASAFDRTANPLVVPQACDCSPSQLINVPAIVNAHATNNNNAAIGLSSTLLDNTGSVRVDLPCGNYYFTNISAGSNNTVSIVAHGRTAIYVNGNIDIPKILNITLTDSAELDVFVKGGVCNNDTIFVGSPSYPARVRFYAGGGNLIAGGSGTTCGSNASRAMSLKTIIGAANLYAPYGEVYMPQTFTLYGSVFAGRANIVQNATFHFDTGVTQANQTCDHCGDGVIQAGEQCDGNALGGKTCGDFGYTGGPLTCSPTCTFNKHACCGDGVKGGVEQCDGADLAGQTTCPAGQTGTLACSASCTFTGCTVTVNNCGNGMIDAGEGCDGANLGGKTCTSVLGVPAGGNLTCTNCQIDSSGCTFCGDGLMNGSEGCDGNDFSTTAGVQNTPPVCPGGGGNQTCSSTCTLDSSGCGTGCVDCRGCTNQACIGGVCGECVTSADCCAPLACVQDPTTGVHSCQIVF